jgi:hypothetical protein
MLLAAVMVALLTGSWMSLGLSWPPDPVSEPAGGPPSPPRSRVGLAANYVVTGDGPVTLTIAVVGDEVRFRDVALPWHKSSGVDFMSLEAQRGAGPGTITCQITGNGQVINEKTASGPYATCLVADVVE